MALPKPARFRPQLKWHDHITFMIFNGLSMAFFARNWSLIFADLWSIFLFFPDSSLNTNWATVNISEPLKDLEYGFQVISRHPYHCPSLGPPSRSAGLPSLLPPAPVPCLDQSPRKGGMPSVLQQENKAFCDICVFSVDAFQQNLYLVDGWFKPIPRIVSNGGDRFSKYQRCPSNPAASGRTPKSV